MTFRQMLAERAWRFQLLRYLAIGGIVFVIDVGSFRLLIVAGVFLAIATTLSFTLAVCVHFTLNKYLNFRVHDRSVQAQASTYVVVAAVAWLVTLAIVEIGVRLGGLPPLASKLVAVAVNIPVGFFGHRYLTFGPGIVRTLQRALARGENR